MSKRVRELLEAADPARGAQVGAGDVEALLLLARADITPHAAVVPARPRGSRLAVVGAACGAIVVVATAITVLQPTPGPPGSPAPSIVPDTTRVPADCLTPIADGLRATSYDGRTGRYEYLHMTGHSGYQIQMPGRPTGVATALFSHETSQWLAADGSGRMRVVRGAPTYPDEASRSFYAQHPDIGPKAGSETKDLRSGDFTVTVLPAANPAAMEQALYQPRENGPSQALVGVAGLNSQRVLDSAHRAAVLRFLAGTEGVTCRGEQTDPAGRSGIAVSAGGGRSPQPSPGDQGREYLLIDPQTGEVLASGVGDATAAGVVTWSTVYLERGHTDVLG
ncbi:CU044_5270 family protein [Micromonospora sp. NPDC049679]|uniref:CU044_5270 family protein n=1 Tax=Micromonospora sp. NPDC049679 TaxID=3155920 RepID=UPI0033CB5AFB